MISPMPIESITIKSYIELGTSGLIIQVLIACGIGAIFFIRAYLKRAKAFFKNLLAKIRKGRNREGV